MTKDQANLPSIEDILAIPAKRIEVSKALTDEETEALEGAALTENPSIILKDENVDVYCKETGDCILKLRKGVIPKKVAVEAYKALEKAGAAENSNRGMAAGRISDEEVMREVERQGGSGFVRLSDQRYKVVKKDGTVSNVTRAKMSHGSIVGFFGRTARVPYCRMTSYTQADFSRFKRSYPIMWWVNRFYEALMPKAWGKQMETAANNSQDFVIEGTAFSTLTVNKNFPTACHYDAGDLRGCFGNLTVIRRGKYEGGITCFPQYDAGVDVQTGDVLLMDVHKLHGNTPIKILEPKAARLALVMYYREDIQQCGTSDEEYALAKEKMEGRMHK